MEKAKKKQYHKCCVKNCNNKISEGIIKYYCFPRSAHKIQQREKWIEWTRKINGNDNWNPSTYAHICSTHFVGNEASCSFLSPSYVPSIHQRNSIKIEEEERLKIKRFQRIVKRKLQKFEWSKEVAKKLAPNSNIVEPSPLFVKVEPPLIKEELIISNTEEKKENFDKKNENSQILKSLLKNKSKNIKTENKQVQVCILEVRKKHLFGTQTVFSCYQQKIDNICHAETQVITPDDIGRILIPKRRKNFKDKCCGTE